MKTLKEYLAEQKNRCWTGYKPVPGKKPYEKGSCTKEEEAVDEHIEKLADGRYRLLSHTGKNLGTFDSHEAAAKHEREVEYFKHTESWDTDDIHEEAEHEGKKVTLNKPFRTPDGPKKFAVYVKNDKGNVVKVTFGDPNMEIKRDDPDRRSNYRARHNCSDPGPKWKANYWSCKMWASKPVSKITS